MMLGDVDCALGEEVEPTAQTMQKFIDSKLEMPVDTKKAGKQQSTHRRDNAYVIEDCVNSQGDQAARKGCYGRPNDCVWSTQNC